MTEAMIMIFCSLVFSISVYGLLSSLSPQGIPILSLINPVKIFTSPKFSVSLPWTLFTYCGNFLTSAENKHGLQI